MITHTETENIALVKRVYDAFNAKDLATLTEAFDQHVRWHAPRTGILAGSYDGRDALFGWFAQLGAETDGTFRPKAITLAAAGDEVFVNNVVTGKRNGRSLEQDEVLIWTVKNGRVTRVRLYRLDQAASEQFWS